MKAFLFAALMLIVSSTHATIRTVSNTPSTLAQFSTIQAAIDASASGDTVYVHGSPSLYASFTITNKKITIIGPGWSPDKNLPLTARVNGCTITGAASSGSELNGLRFENNIVINTIHPDNLRFIRNTFGSPMQITQINTTYSGYLFEGNVFNSTVHASTTSSYQNFIFQNNYFYKSSVGGANYNILGFTNSVNVLFDHNLWFGPSSGSVACFSTDCRFLTITNNIFVRRDAATDNSFSTFNNNITFNAGTNNPWAVNNNVDGGGNVENQDPMMADQAAVNAGTNNPLLNFTIASGPANNSGSDGKDMGLLFDATGSLNWTISRTSRLPFIYSMNITNPTIQPGGTLNVQVEARKNN